jgi:hypothetical protein
VHAVLWGRHLAAFIEEQSANEIVAVAGSNGYSAAVRAARSSNARTRPRPVLARDCR